MKFFKRFNRSGAPCPICGTLDNKSSVLIPINGMEKGDICECLQIHLDCIDLRAYRDNDEIMIGMSFDDLSIQE